VSDKNILL